MKRRSCHLKTPQEIKFADKRYARVKRAFKAFTIVQDIDTVYEAGRLAGKTVHEIDRDLEALAKS